MLAGVAVVAAVVGWAGVALLVDLGESMPRVPVSAPLVLLLFAAILLATALSIRSRLAAVRERLPDARPLNPLMAARAAVLAKASSPVGALVAGLYAGYAAYLLPEAEISARRQVVLLCGFAVLAGAAVVAAALFLESVCRLPPPDEESGRSVGGAEQST
jgi:hypothetical protein